MTRFRLLSVLAFSICLLTYNTLHAQTLTDTATLLHTGDTAPDVTFETSPGKTNTFADYRGKIVFIDFFATWCGPCREEFPHLTQKVWNVYKDDPHFVFLAFGREHNWKEVEAFKKKVNPGFPLLPDVGRNVFGKFATSFIPRNVILDENGKIIWQTTGYVPQEFEAMLQLLQQTMAARKATAAN
ncbi:TlpA family protein disulfide reductase [Chitinophaga vietnamensis]|uniref:TlpA family protein disulfide reductase n=1 Tax=Chitinophaga vietnamensis TaxID=2593957 RepID=UPI001178807B|nr:TlpA disulfide reductase family protein [Chitinophaga vietnamensis]